ncbi:hypothetical protein B0H17DRAFT_1106230 [Mycena rosella]|uniref:Uncharacterized protein n=1 Tax=Mycena rosella TaxID=1033263 RepID=A0AAD7C3D8_MYCRO|nr:hypothetical protein B0H17DRAFT_1106230 [Mycena rosella]
MPHSGSPTTESASLPPINILFAEVLQRQLDQPSSPPVRRPSAWPGFPGPDRNALSTSGHPHASPPPPLRLGRRPSGNPPPADALISPSIFTPRDRHARDHRPSSGHNSHRTSRIYVEMQESPRPSRRPRTASWSESVASRSQPSPEAPRHDTARLPPISMTPTGSPRLYERETPRARPRQSDPACHHCTMDHHIDDRRAAALARGPIRPESPYAHKQQIPTPLPPAHGHTMIPFQPTPSAHPGRAFGVSMADILHFRECLKDPDTPVLDNGIDQVFLTLEVRLNRSPAWALFIVIARRRATRPSCRRYRGTAPTGA